MSGISLAMIVKNEAAILEQSMASVVPFVNEVVIVDTGSTDDTKKIAARYTDKIFDFEWVNSFAAARNFADAHATQDYVLTWDADYVLDTSSQSILAKHLKHIDNKDIYLAELLNDFHRETKEVWQSEPRYLIYKKKSFEWIYPVHNDLKFVGSGSPRHTLMSGVRIWHYKQPSNVRYEQTLALLESTLPTLGKGNQEYLRLQFFYIQDLLNAGELQKAEEACKEYLAHAPNTEKKAVVIEKFVIMLLEQARTDEAQLLTEQYNDELKKFPLFLLAWADAHVFAKPEASRSIYEWFVANEPYSSTLVGTNFKRFVEHPRTMLHLLASI